MLKDIKISGFKNFRNRSVELKDLKKINLLVGVNGSGKSSVLELLALSSRFDLISSPAIPIEGSNLYELNSLFSPATTLEMRFDNDTLCSYKITPKLRNQWLLEKNGAPEASMEVVLVWRSRPFSESGSPENRPFGDLREVKLENVDSEDLLYVQDFLLSVNPNQRIVQTTVQRLEEYHTENGSEVWPVRLSGGIQYLGMLFKAIRVMPQGRPSSILLIDDLGDSIYPELRKSIIIGLKNELDKVNDPRAQIFATTHNIEIVKSALENPEYCRVYMFDYDGSLIEFDESGARKVDASPGLNSSQIIPAVAKMLGFTDLDLGFPEIVFLVEEETKRTFLNALKNNPNMTNLLKNYEVQVPFQAGDGNVSRGINNLLDLSKYFFFSEIWSDRYVIFTDFNLDDYNQDGTAKDDTPHRKALRKAQEKLGLGQRFLITKRQDQIVDKIEDTYPEDLWLEFKSKESITNSSISDWLAESNNGKGKKKNELAEFVGSNITHEALKNLYPEIGTLIIKQAV